MIGRSLNAACSSFRVDAGPLVRSSPTSATVMDSSLTALSIHLDHRRDLPSSVEDRGRRLLSPVHPHYEKGQERSRHPVVMTGGFRARRLTAGGALSNFRER